MTLNVSPPINSISLICQHQPSDRILLLWYRERIFTATASSADGDLSRAAPLSSPPVSKGGAAVVA
ncbi:hypothetical protein TYRP_002058 [Tyrophagus putrescentiae]|nr:hypothetical protein TYRP_002058 [Tyrophagus putrescentiae]